jgi:hypothetical protein
MAGITHPFVSAKADSGDTTLVRPVDWNDVHDITDYLDIAEIGLEPDSPGADTLRVYAIDQNGFTVFEGKGPTGQTRRFARDSYLIGKCAEPGGVTAGQTVYISGATGANEQFKLARSNSNTTMPAVGIVLDSVAQNGFARILFSGKDAGLDTNAFSDGDPLYVSPSTPGALTATKPTFPDIIQRIGIVTHKSETEGEVLVNPPGQMLEQIEHASLGSIGANDHHAQVHDMNSNDHTSTALLAMALGVFD